MKTRRRNVTKERIAVALSIRPTKLAADLFGSPRDAERKLGLRADSFRSWDYRNRIPKTIWSILQARSPEVLNKVTLREETIIGRSFAVPTRLVNKVTTMVTTTPVKVEQVRPTPASKSDEAVSAFQRYVTKLEQENARLRTALQAVRTVTASVPE